MKNGRSLTELTVSRKLSLFVAPFPSVTVSVMVAVPNWSAPGVIVMVRFAPLPPNTIWFCGVRFGFDELALTAKPAGGVSASPTVKARAAVAPSSRIVWLAICEMVGGLFYDNYPAGTGLVSGATFGRIAGRNAAKMARA